MGAKARSRDISPVSMPWLDLNHTRFASMRLSDYRSPANRRSQLSQIIKQRFNICIQVFIRYSVSRSEHFIIWFRNNYHKERINQKPLKVCS